MHIRTLSISLGLALASLSAAQQFEVTHRTLPNGKSVEEQTGEMGRWNPNVAGGPEAVRALARQHAEGFEQIAKVAFREEADSVATSAVVRTVNHAQEPFTGPVERQESFSFRKAETGLIRRGNTIELKPSDSMNGAYSSDLMQLIYLNRLPSGNEAPNEGSYLAGDPGFPPLKVEWRTRRIDGKEWVEISQNLPDGKGGFRTALTAKVSADRSKGTYQFLDSKGKATHRTTFRKTAPEAGSFDFTKAFPHGLSAIDYRKDWKHPERYTWSGSLDHPVAGPFGLSLAAGDGQLKLGLGTLGAVLLATGIFRLRGRRRS